MSGTSFDHLAATLREVAQRFGETAFTDRRRLVSLLSDRLPEARRDIKVVAAAVDERVFETLRNCQPDRLGMEVERLAANLENGLGIRNDVATPVLHACAYALAVGPLPSQVGLPAAAPLPPPIERSSNAWVGLSEPVAPAPAAIGAGPSTGASERAGAGDKAIGSRRKTFAIWTVLGVVAVLAGLAYLGKQDDRGAGPQPSRPAPVQPTVQPNPVQPAASPQPHQPNPAPQPFQAGPSPQPAPQPAPQSAPPAPPGGIQAPSFGNETVDLGVPPQTGLKADVGTPTPTSVPGAHTVTTAQLATEMRQNHRLLLVDSLADPHPSTIAGAVYLPYSGQFGSFSDQIQSRLANELNSLTQGKRDMPVVFFCQGVRCWESYNAVLRARAAGFPNVFWYRGGLQAWQQAQLPMQQLQR